LFYLWEQKALGRPSHKRPSLFKVLQNASKPGILPQQFRVLFFCDAWCSSFFLSPAVMPIHTCSERLDNFVATFYNMVTPAVHVALHKITFFTGFILSCGPAGPFYIRAAVKAFQH